MVKHLTVRLAWHDNKWDGTVCQDPEANVYCVGSHSLLSERLARNRDLDIEKKNKGKRIDKISDDYLPPCYWSANAFSKQALTVWHNHPFSQYQDHVIKDKLSGHSVFSWPFRLAFVHDKNKKKLYGSYPPDLEDRIDQFQKSFTKDESIVFLYLNYDNPISADDSTFGRGKFALVGCATLNEITPGKHFDSFTQAELNKIKKGRGMKNFPTLNWAITVSYDFDSGVLLPYHEYLEHIEKNPDDEELLDQMKVLIDDEDLRQNFTYVAMDMNDDACIYTLTLLRNSFRKIKEHGIMEQPWIKDQIEKIDKLLERTWKLRGIYPSLGNILDVVADLDEDKHGTGNEIISIIKKNNSGKDTLDIITKLLTKKTIPKYLANFSPTINDMFVNISDYNMKLLQKLSLFSLSQTQIKNIVTTNSTSFKKQIDKNDIIKNPYLLCETYRKPEQVNNDELEISDKKIGTFTIDIGMFPDSSYLSRNIQLQDLTVSHPYRVRAIITDHLKTLENNGDCYAQLDQIFEMLKNYPLFYKPEDSFSVDKSDLVSKKYIDHFEERITVVKNKFFYLNEIIEAEKLIKTTILKLLKRDDHKTRVDNLDKYLEGEADQLSSRSGFNRDQFIAERTKLVEGCIKKSFFVITGKPGTGKTQALKKVIQELEKEGQGCHILAPTGKASLRLKTATGDPNAKTIDRLIYSTGDYKKILEDFEDFSSNIHLGDSYIRNLIIDESSMLDLKKFAVLLKMLYDKKNNMEFTKRIILVGDENQLPPIGYGRPFFDIIEFLKSNKKYSDENYVRLETNCRQKFDDNILEITDLFGGKKRYYEERISEISSGKFSSPGFDVQLWDNETELRQKINTRLEDVVKSSGGKTSKEKSSQLNHLFGLNEDGSVQSDYQFEKTMNLDRWQLITPYRSGYFGTLGLNDYIKSEYRERSPIEDKIWGNKIPFTHSDKIICIKNQYVWDRANHVNDLKLSNGSMGLVNLKEQPFPPRRRFYFSDLPEGGLDYLPGKNDDDYELAYGITIHKSQGSEFEHTFVVLPKKRALLSRELIYTALSRSTDKVTLFLQKTSDNSILEQAMHKSAILPRETSIFEEPQEDRKLIYEPRKGVYVRSKIEYMLFKELEQSGINFDYEEPLKVKKLANDDFIEIKPDFTIKLGKKKLFLEHLGMLTNEKYAQEFTQLKRPTYEKNGFSDELITTDDSSGVKTEKILELIRDLKTNNLKKTPDSKFSEHHYELY